MHDEDAAVAVSAGPTGDGIKRRDVETLDVFIDNGIQNAHRHRAASIIGALAKDSQVANAVVVHEQPIAGIGLAAVDREPQAGARRGAFQRIGHAHANQVIAGAGVDVDPWHRSRRGENERLRERVEGEAQMRGVGLHGVDRVVAGRGRQSQHVESARTAVERDARGRHAGIGELRAGLDDGAGGRDLETADAQRRGREVELVRARRARDRQGLCR